MNLKWIQPVCVIAILMLLLAGWFYARIDRVAIGSTRGFPYPDGIIARWERALDAAHPIASDSLKIEGEFPRIELHLTIAMIASGFAATATGIPILLKRKNQK